MGTVTRTLLVVMALTGVLEVDQASGLPVTTLESTNGSIQQGDLIFSNFSVPSFVVAAGNVTPVTYSGIDVQGITVFGEQGLRFSGPFAATSNPLSSAIALATYHISFDVTVD